MVPDCDDDPSSARCFRSMAVAVAAMLILLCGVVGMIMALVWERFQVAARIVGKSFTFWHSIVSLSILQMMFLFVSRFVPMKDSVQLLFVVDFIQLFSYSILAIIFVRIVAIVTKNTSSERLTYVVFGIVCLYSSGVFIYSAIHSSNNLVLCTDSVWMLSGVSTLIVSVVFLIFSINIIRSLSPAGLNAHSKEQLEDLKRRKRREIAFLCIILICSAITSFAFNLWALLAAQESNGFVRCDTSLPTFGVNVFLSTLIRFLIRICPAMAVIIVFVIIPLANVKRVSLDKGIGMRSQFGSGYSGSGRSQKDSNSEVLETSTPSSRRPGMTSVVSNPIHPHVRNIASKDLDIQQPLLINEDAFSSSSSSSADRRPRHPKPVAQSILGNPISFPR